ncbi:ficolin-2-like [Mytilus galloprovincialis]|uniref:ficolin-2-like n=1 Tax=Mytilus galloprovincialis TaxID=29158 RepID=UPI003F7B9DDE
MCHVQDLQNTFGKRTSDHSHISCQRCCNNTHICNTDLNCDNMNNIPKECEDLHSNRSGVYTIYPTNEHQPVQVFCIMEYGKKWTVIQRRYNGSVDFNRTWNEYKDGFGSAYGEYWIGNSHIHQMSINGSHELSVLLVKKNGIKAYANYSKFSVGDEQSQFLLHITGYHGDAGDSMSSSGGILGGNMKRFTTKDRDNDDYINNCAQTFKGGWWYGECRWSGINEIYRLGTLYWESSPTIVSSIMMIRRT